MALYIKDSTVDELVEQVRVQLGMKSKTDAVRVALMHELQRSKRNQPLRERLARLRERRAEMLPETTEGLDMKKLMDEISGEAE